MKKHVVLIMIYLILILATPITLSVFAFCLPPQYEDTFLGELKYKYENLQHTAGKRIIVIGGSSVTFGQYSDLMEAELPDYTVINFGMYAGLGSAVMLDLAQPYIRKGDIVIFSPEQSRQTLSMYFNSEAMWEAVDGGYQMLFDLSKKNLGAMTGQFVYFAVNKFNYFRAENAPAPEGVYNKSSFNDYGDIVYEGRDQNMMSGGFDPNTPIYFDKDMISDELLSYLNSYAEACEERGVRFYYRFCPMNARAISEENRSGIDAYYEYLQSVMDFQIIGNPNTSVMEAEWFYDTNFHLNHAGAIVNTRALVQDIKQVLKDPSLTKIILPEMPELYDYHVTQGDNSDDNNFLYEERNGELQLVGLTKEGQQKESLILPTEHEGLPVTTFAPTLFAHNTTVREITVQSNIIRIENLSFDGCNSLERLILLNPHPENCSVSGDLLSGTECNIYVPQQSISTYMTNYFWSVYSDRIFVDAENVNAPVEIDNEGNASVAEIQLDKVYAPVAESQIDEVNDPVAESKMDVYETITYDANGGTCKNSGGDTVKLPLTTGHVRVNTALGNQLFKRDGYVLMGWNTKADGTGEYIGFGSRTEKREDLVLYAQWEKATEAADFNYYTKDGEIRITKYLGEGRICAIPEQIDGLPVRRICTDSFAGAQIDTLILPASVFAVERKAFTGSSIREIYLYDSLYYIYDESFADCENLTTLHVNAATPPVYSGSYFDTFSDKFDWLLSIKNKKKIVLFSGSSGRFGYDSLAMLQAFPEYQVANMGVYAYTNALPQLMIIKTLMKEGDILLSAPEFDTIKNQFCATNALDQHFYAMMESNYDAIALLDLKDYSGVFDSLGTYLTTRSNMGGKSYSISPSHYDDEGRHYDYETYNQYGDFILERPNGERDELLQTYLADYTVSAFPTKVIQSMNSVYQKFLDHGIKVYFSYAPRNRSSITAASTWSARKDLHRYLQDNLCVPVISDIEDYLYSGIYFYFIDNHLSDQGVQMRTEQIIDDISAQLESEQEVIDE